MEWRDHWQTIDPHIWLDHETPYGLPHKSFSTEYTMITQEDIDRFSPENLEDEHYGTFVKRTKYRMMSPMDMMREFHRAFGITWYNRPSRKLHQEEYEELQDAMTDYHLDPGPKTAQALTKEMADVLYVVYGTADVLGIDLDEAFRRVHISNMSKLDDNGQPIRREDGKALKGPNYREPDLSDLV